MGDLVANGTRRSPKRCSSLNLERIVIYERRKIEVRFALGKGFRVGKGGAMEVR